MKAIISGSMVVGLGLILLLVAVGLAPKFVLWFGIILIALCIGANIKAGADLLRLSDRMDTSTTLGKMVFGMLKVLAVVQGFSCRLLRLNQNEKWRCGLRIAVYGIIGLVLVVAGQVVGGYKADRERTVAKQATQIAEQRQKVIDAKVKAEALVAEAESAWKIGNSELAEQMLDSASKIPYATGLASIGQLRIRIGNAKVDSLVVDATTALKVGDVDAAREKIKAALAVPNADANALVEVRKLDRQSFNGADPIRIKAALLELSDEDFQ